MELISTPLAVVLVVGGTAAMLAAMLVARREPLPARGRGRPGRWAMLVPWVGSLLVVALLVRGALAGAGLVAVATLLYAGLQRARTLGGGGGR